LSKEASVRLDRHRHTITHHKHLTAAIQHSAKDRAENLMIRHFN